MQKESNLKELVNLKYRITSPFLLFYPYVVILAPSVYASSPSTYHAHKNMIEFLGLQFASLCYVQKWIIYSESGDFHLYFSNK